MGTARRIYKNTLYLGAAEIISRVLQFVVMLYAARILDKGSFGKFSFALSLSFIALVLADLGIDTLLIREISRNKEKASRYFINAFAAKVILSIITFFGVIAALKVMDYPADTRNIVYIVWLFTIISTFTELFYSIFRSFEMMAYDALLKILRMVLLSAASLYVLLRGYGVLAFSYTFVAVEIIVVFAALVIALSRKFIKFEAKLDYGLMKSLVKMALPFGLALVFGSIYFYIGSVMLSKIRGDAEVAIYSVAYNIALAILFIPTVYTNAIYPVLSRYFKESKEMLNILYERSFKYLYIIGIPISIGLYLLSARVIYFFYGSSYSGSIIALQIISWYLFIKFLNFLLGTVLSSVDQQKKRMLGQGITALFNVALNLLLIPKIGYVGAAWSTLITEIFLFILYYHYVSRCLYFYNFANILIRPAIAVILMALFIKFTNLGLILTIILSAIIYFTALFVSKALDAKDHEILKRITGNDRIQKT